jgi:rhodanese-related sulfurtransferase
MHDYSDLRRILLEALIIVSLGVVIGLSTHLSLLHQVLTGEPPAVTGPAETGTAAEPAEAYPTPVDLTSVRRLTESGQALLIDARITELFAAEHISGARSLPLEEADRLLPRLLQQVPPATTLITYCNGYGCPDSFDLAIILITAGYQDVRVFEGGLPEWQDAGLPTATGEQP